MNRAPICPNSFVETSSKLCCCAAAHALNCFWYVAYDSEVLLGRACCLRSSRCWRSSKVYAPGAATSSTPPSSAPSSSALSSCATDSDSDSEAIGASPSSWTSRSERTLAEGLRFRVPTRVAAPPPRGISRAQQLLQRQPRTAKCVARLATHVWRTSSRHCARPGAQGHSIEEGCWGPLRVIGVRLRA